MCYSPLIVLLYYAVHDISGGVESVLKSSLPTSSNVGRPGVMVKWSKIVDHDHGQNLKIAVVKWSKMAIFDQTIIQELLWSIGQNWSILTIDHGQN